MIEKEGTFFEKIKEKLNNNKIYVFVLIFCGFIIGMVNFIKSINEGVGFFNTPKTPEIVDINIREEPIINDTFSNVKVKKDTLQIIETNINNAFEYSKYSNLLILDLKLRNPTSETIYLKEALINVKHIWQLYFNDFVCPSADGFVATGSYDINIDLRKPTPYKIRKKISQPIKGNEVDRFLLRIQNISNNDKHIFAIHLSVELIYNAKNNKLKTEDIILIFQPEFIQGCFPFLVDLEEKEQFYRYKNYTQDYWTNGLYGLEYGAGQIDITEIFLKYYSLNYKSVKEIYSINARREDALKSIIKLENFQVDPNDLQLMQ